MADISINDDYLDELFVDWLNNRTAKSKRAFIEQINLILQDRIDVARQRNEALRRLDALQSTSPGNDNAQR